MSTGESVASIVVGFIVCYILLWCFVLWVISRLSGWHRLAERFGAASAFGGEPISFVSARIGWANYSGMLIVGANEEGLYLAPIRIYRPFHETLFIPWAETEADVRGRARWPRVQLTFPTVPGKRILLYGRSAAHCMPHIQRSFGNED